MSRPRYTVRPAGMEPAAPGGEMSVARLRAICLPSLAVVLAACGGGSDSSPPQAAPSGAPAPVTSATPASPAGAWRPATTDTWQWQLTGVLNTSYNVAVYDIDLFDTSPETLTQLKVQGRRVVCYFSAGTSENWRADFAKFQPSDMGAAVGGWAGEKWLDTRSDNVRAIMKARLDLARSKGCDGVEPDNMDAYSNNSGFPLTPGTQLDFNRFIAAEARARGLAVGLKNDVDQIAELVNDFDFAVNEQCHQFDECAPYEAFLKAGKAVFNAEYRDAYKSNAAGARDALCASSRAAGIRTLVLPLQLDDAFRFSCD
jgi:hypothetical protein